MADTYVYLIHEPDWDSDYAASPEAQNDPEFGASMGAHGAFAEAVVALGARLVGGHALTGRYAIVLSSDDTKYGGTVVPGAADRKVDDAVYTDGPFTDTSEVITGLYVVETDDEVLARKLAALVPTGGHIEWRKVIPLG